MCDSILPIAIHFMSMQLSRINLIVQNFPQNFDKYVILFNNVGVWIISCHMVFTNVRLLVCVELAMMIGGDT